MDDDKDSKIAHTTDAEFDDAIAEGLTLIDFWAPWCGPCLMIAPTLEEIAEEMEGKLNIVKLNVDDNPETSPKFGVQGIPTMILFKDGKLVDRVVGAVPKAALVDMIGKHIEE